MGNDLFYKYNEGQKNGCGIYKISNKHLGKVYIGSAVNFDKRYRVHKNALNSNSHFNIHLQRAYCKLPEDWIFEIVEECTRDKLIERELYYIELLKDNIYNVKLSTDGRILHSQETIDKISTNRKGKRKGIKPDNYESLRKNWLKPIDEFENGEFIRSFSSAKEAGEFHNIDRRYLWLILNGKIKQIGKNNKRKDLINKTWKYRTI